jgi:hypothetical protein
LPPEQKSIRPREIGGIAGGKKFLLRGILFKLADGSRGGAGLGDGIGTVIIVIIIIIIVIIIIIIIFTITITIILTSPLGV